MVVKGIDNLGKLRLGVVGYYWLSVFEVLC